MSMRASTSKGVFITGTDTGVGKTLVACALIRRLADAGVGVVGMKPVAAGIETGADCNEDVLALATASNVAAPLRERNPYVFAAPIAPHLAAQRTGIAIEQATIRDAYDALAARAHAVVVEGAGGALVPLGARCDMLDVAVTLQLPVVVVVGMRLGCLNHALLTALAIRLRGLRLAGWVANRIDPAMRECAANIAALESRLAAPRLASVEWGGAIEWACNSAWRALLDRD